MPNWCNNKLVINATSTEQKERLKTFDSENFFESIIPLPDTIKKDSEDAHIWRLNNWGCKWDASILSFEKTENQIIAEFDTPWSPPIELYEDLHMLGFSLHAYYYEPGVDFAGVFEDGQDECIDDFAHNVKTIPNDALVAELMDVFGLEPEDFEYE